MLQEVFSGDKQTRERRVSHGIGGAGNIRESVS